MQTHRIPLLGVLAATLAFAAPAHASTIEVAGRHADVYGKPTTGRVFLFHGLNGNRTFVHEPAFRPLLAGLRARGWQVVVPDLPYDGRLTHQARAVRHALRSGGMTYRATWTRYVSRLITAAEKRYGTTSRVMVGGVSWGGFHALMAACNDPRVTGYFAQTPVVDPRSLIEFSALPLADLTPWSGGCAQRLAAIPGYISWGGRDTRVGTTAVTRLMGALRGLKAPVVGREFPLMGHETPPEAAHGILSWVR
jgi:dienelactone hydrolase